MMKTTPSKIVSADNNNDTTPNATNGIEKTGRWTKEEHEAFLVGLELYGKEWKKVAMKVKTRTVVQTRTHAQKYFQKLAKGGGEVSLLSSELIFYVGLCLFTNYYFTEWSRW